jgi:hypothetical protein
VSLSEDAHTVLPRTPYCRAQYEGPAACRCERLRCCPSVHGLVEPGQVLPVCPSTHLPFCQPWARPQLPRARPAGSSRSSRATGRDREGLAEAGWSWPRRRDLAKLLGWVKRNSTRYSRGKRWLVLLQTSYFRGHRARTRKSPNPSSLVAVTCLPFHSGADAQHNPIAPHPALHMPCILSSFLPELSLDLFSCMNAAGAIYS